MMTLITDAELKICTFSEKGSLKRFSPDTFIVHDQNHSLRVFALFSSWTEFIHELNLFTGRQIPEIVDEIWAYICVYSDLLLPDITGFRWCHNNSTCKTFVYNEV